MAKKSANKGASQATEETIDISQLTPAQLAALQKQLKASRATATGGKEGQKERFNIIDTMLQEKNEDGTFKNTTRNILEKLVQEKLVDDSIDGYAQIEIKKIQARKQFLEKKRDEKGELVWPAGTFGYKASDHIGFGLSADRVVKWFTDEDGASKLSTAQKKQINELIA